MMNDSTPDDIPPPARPEKLTVEFYEEPDGLAIHKKRAGGPGCFLFLWLTGWTAGCVVLIGVLINNFSFGMLMFAMPFWVSWIAVASMLCWMIFGKETLLVRREDALFLRRVFSWKLSSRVVPKSEIRGFRECLSTHTENDHHLHGIEMVTLGKPIRFAFRLPDGERAWLVHQLNQFLGTSAAAMEVEPMPLATGVTGGKLLGARASSAEVRASRETLASENTLVDPPSDATWTLTEDFQDFTIENRGRFHPVSVAFLLFITLFWNGIVSVFVLVLLGLMPGGGSAPKGGEWWFLFFFLIPFEVIGLCILSALLLAIFEPLRRTEWRFKRDQIARQSRLLFFRRVREHGVIDLGRLELRRLNATERGVSTVLDPTASHSYALAFITADNSDLCSIPDLTEGEARWIARVILDRRQGWFDNRM